MKCEAAYFYSKEIQEWIKAEKKNRLLKWERKYEIGKMFTNVFVLKFIKMYWFQSI